ncbi:hypothetical protein [Actinacidiphila sp. bgisy144]|uniref:hypothetical protein n=1 Tax=Actinacidiphila sp. bgisy144 TaxID=3413791 RepID=UPI003EBC4E8F
MASRVLSLRIDAELWDRINAHAAKRGMSAQDYVVRTLMRDDFDERFKTAVEATDRFYADAPRSDERQPPAGPGPAARDPAARRTHPPAAPGPLPVRAPAMSPARSPASAPAKAPTWAPAGAQPWSQTRPSAGIR